MKQDHYMTLLLSFNNAVFWCSDCKTYLYEATLLQSMTRQHSQLDHNATTLANNNRLITSTVKFIYIFSPLLKKRRTFFLWTWEKNNSSAKDSDNIRTQSVLGMFNLRTVPGLLFTFVICSVTTLFADFCYATLPHPLIDMHEWSAAWRGRCRVVQTGSWSGILPPSYQARKYFLKKFSSLIWKHVHKGSKNTVVPRMLL